MPAIYSLAAGASRVSDERFATTDERSFSAVPV
jgi:hypothetical protein